MKRACFVLAMLAAAAQTAHADEDPLLLRVRELERDGRRLRLEGILTTAAGAGMLVGTTWLWLEGENCGGADPACDGAKWILMITGLPTTGFGITMWWLGQHEINRARNSVVPWIAPSRGGALAGVTLLAF